METKVIHIDGPLTLQKVPAPSQDNCDGCFFKNMSCDEARARLRDRKVQDNHTFLACTKDNYIWEVADAAVDEG